MAAILPFSELNRHDVHRAGGKGASLGEMVQAGIPVPNGFVISSEVFLGLSDDLAQEILQAFDVLGSEYVAVRSSATAEDSAAASWAGELESYLNTTRDTLLQNIQKCWASLDSPRAVAYRQEKGLADAHVAVAVVVQKMVQSEIAGIAFTVHPVSKNPEQMIIEAGWGLGELIVGGEITPDTYIIEKTTGKVLEVYQSEQEEMLVRGTSGNRRVPVDTGTRAMRKLDDAALKELTSICANIEKHYGFPCDIEWAYEGGKFFIVQSRPITTL